MMSNDPPAFEKKKYLKTISVFSSFSEEELELLIPHFQEKKFKTDEWIIKEGETGNFLVLIVSGKVGVYKKDPHSKKLFLIKEIGENEIVGEMALLQQAPRSACILALETTSALILSIEQLNPDLLLKIKNHLFKYTAKRLTDTNLIYIAENIKRARILLLLILLGFISLFLLFFISGYLPDREAERVVEQLYPRNKNGIIIGNETIEHFTGNSTLVFFLHGYMESPDTFNNVIEGLEAKNLPVDYYAPVAPFHSKNLQEMRQLNIKSLLEFYGDEIERFATKYKEVILVGYSMGGAVLIALDQENRIPQNCSLILYAPAIYLKTNNFKTRLQFKLYSFWRNYCNYNEVNCSYPVYESGDSEAKEKLEQEKNLRYRVASATSEIFKLDLLSRDHLAHIHRPYSLILADDDNRVSVESLKQACKEDAPYCKLYTFPSGKHVIHWGKNRQGFIDLLAELILQFQAKSEPENGPILLPQESSMAQKTSCKT